MREPDLERFDRMRKQMEIDDLDVIVCRLAENVLVLSGYYPVIGYACVVFPREGDPILIAISDEEEHYNDGWIRDVRTFRVWDAEGGEADHLMAAPKQIAARLAEVGAEGRFPADRVGYEGSFDYIAPPILAAEPAIPNERTRAAIQEAFPNAELVDATDTLNRVRAVKSEIDLQALRRVNEVTGFGFEALKQRCFEQPCTEAEASAAFQAAVTSRGIGYKGARFAMAWPQVAGGVKTGSWSYYLPTEDRPIEEGDLVLCEVAVCVDGYWTDWTRTFCVGEPSQEQVELFELVNNSLQMALEACEPGAVGGDIDTIAREALGEHKTAMGHHTGHGLGWKYHEPIPMLVPGGEDVLEPGMTFAVEPAVYLRGKHGVRNEENVFCTEDGIEVLSSVYPVSLT